jgi:hypothetical protein
MAGANLGAGVGKARAYERVGPQRGRVRDALVAFRAAQDADAADEHAWCTGVAAALADLRDAWEAHVAFTEDAEDGLFAELLEDNVEVAAPEVDHLRRDHLTVDAALTRAGELVGGQGAGPADTKLRDALAAVTKQIEAHRRRGAELLYRVYSVDPTGGGS